MNGPALDLSDALAAWRDVLAKLPSSLREEAQRRLDEKWAPGVPSDAGSAVADMLDAAPAYLRARLRTALAAGPTGPYRHAAASRVADVEGQRVNLPFALTQRDASVLLQTPIVSVERLPVDTDVVTYAAVTGSGARRLVRLSPLAGRGASRAAHCLELLYRDSHLPVPRVLLADDAGETLPHAVLVLTQPGGEPLTQALALAGGKQMERLLWLFGAALAQAHRVSLPACGPLDGHGLVQPQSWGWWYDAMVADALATAGRTPLARVCADAQAWLSARRGWVPDTATAHLLVGAPAPGDLFVEGDAVTALLGFESAMAGDPSFDVARAEGQLSGPRSRTSAARERGRQAFLDGYASEGALPPDYDQRRQVYRVVHLLRSAKALTVVPGISAAAVERAHALLRAALERAIADGPEA